MSDDYGYLCGKCLEELETHEINGQIVLARCANGCPP